MPIYLRRGSTCFLLLHTDGPIGRQSSEPLCSTLFGLRAPLDPLSLIELLTTFDSGAPPICVPLFELVEEGEVDSRVPTRVPWDITVFSFG
jgi:hypothetical protein